MLVNGGGLAAVGSPVFNLDGKAVGVVMYQQGQPLLLNDRRAALTSITSPPKLFVPARDFLLTMQDPPTPQKAVELPWLGAPELKGLTKEVAEALNLKNQPAIQVEYVIPDAPAAKAGLKQGDIILKFNGKPLERGDEDTELPGDLQTPHAPLQAGRDGDDLRASRAGSAAQGYPDHARRTAEARQYR